MRKVCRYLQIYVAFFSLFLISSYSYAYEYKIAVVISGDLKEYNQAYNGIIHCPDWKGTKVNIHPIYFDSFKSLETYKKLQSLQPDLIFAIGNRATKSLAQSIKDIPIVFCMVFDKEFLSHLRKNGNSNVFGVDSYFAISTQLENLKEILPEDSRVGILYDPNNSHDYIEEATLKAEELNLNLVIKEVLTESDVLSSLESIRTDIDVLLSIPDRTIYSPQSMKAIILFSLRNKIPLVGLSSKNVASGALFSLFCSYSDLGFQAVHLAIEVLNGKKFPDLYIEEPRKQLLAINLRTAEVLDITLSEEIIHLAVMIYGLEDTR